MLLHGVAVAQRYGVVFQRLMVNRYAIGSTYGILAAITFANGVLLVDLSVEVQTKAVENLACLLRESVFAHKRHHSHLHRGQSSRQVKHYAPFAALKLLVFVA